jgi:hypothetical protein
MQSKRGAGSGSLGSAREVFGESSRPSIMHMMLAQVSSMELASKIRLIRLLLDGVVSRLYERVGRLDRMDRFGIILLIHPAGD